MEDKALELRNVSVVRDGRYILRSVDLDIFRGESVAIIGPNGSGKTTLIRLLRGDILPFYDEGSPATIRIFGQERWNIFDIRTRMGIVSSDLHEAFSPDASVFEVICSGFYGTFGLSKDWKITDGMRSKVYGTAVMMGIEDLLTRSIDCLSLGEMRRTMIARALVNDPELLILDEPMTGLDVVMKSKFRRMFDILIRNGVSIVMVTHDPSDIPKVGKVICVRDGGIQSSGSMEDMLTDHNLSELYGESIKVIESEGYYQMYLNGDEQR